jgi:hypothetical protein
MKKGFFLCLTLFVLSAASVNAQVLIGGTGNPADEPADGALLELRAADKGLLIPRVALTATNSATPLTGKVAGMVVYNTGTGGLTDKGVYYNDGANWVKIGSGALNAVATANGTGTTVSGTGSSASPLKVDIAAGGVGTTQLADGAVTLAKIANGNVTVDKLADNSVNSAKIVNGSVATDDLADAVVTAGKIAQMGAADNQVLTWSGTEWQPASVRPVVDHEDLRNGKYFHVLTTNTADPAVVELQWPDGHSNGEGMWELVMCKKGLWHGNMRESSYILSDRLYNVPSIWHQNDNSTPEGECLLRFWAM